MVLGMLAVDGDGVVDTFGEEDGVDDVVDGSERDVLVSRDGVDGGEDVKVRGVGDAVNGRGDEDGVDRGAEDAVVGLDEEVDGDEEEDDGEDGDDGGGLGVWKESLLDVDCEEEEENMMSW